MENVNQIKTFTNSVFGEVRAIKIEGKAWFVGNDVATVLGYVKPNNAINTHCQSTLKQGIPHPQSPGKVIEVNVINEYDVIRLIMKSKLPQAQEFEKWVIEEVIPSILTTGTYNMKQDSYMIEDPIERAKRWIEEEEVRRQLELDNQEKQKLIEKQEERIQEQETEIVHKEDVIISLTKDVTLKEKRQRIVDIVKYGAKGRYSERWGLLYKEFDGKFHINTKVRLERAKERGEVLKSTTRMDYICDVLGLTNELFDLCTVLFEADYIEMLEYYLDTAKR